MTPSSQDNTAHMRAGLDRFKSNGLAGNQFSRDKEKSQEIKYDFLDGFEHADDFFSTMFLAPQALNQLINYYNSTRVPFVPLFENGKVSNFNSNQSVPDGINSLNAIKEIVSYLGSEGFYSVEQTHGVPRNWILLDEKNLPISSAAIVAGLSDKSPAVFSHLSFVGSEKNALALNDIVNKYAVPEPEADQKVNILMDFKDTPQGLLPNVQEQILNDTMDYSMAEFYPWVKMDLTEYFAEFLASKENVLVMIGPPGTGKSTFIRTMLRRLKVESLISYKTSTISHPEFITFCSNFLKYGANGNVPRNLGGYNSSDGIPPKTNRVVVVEDGDELMAKRSNGNHVMSEILNLTNGIVSSSENKFIFSTNLDEISDIDPALLRPGRCFDVMCFRTLTAEEANKVRIAAKLEPRDFDPKRSYKLAEVLNDSVTENRIETTVKPRFGFAP